MLPWDNTPRYASRAIVHLNTDNDAYKLWLEQAYVDSFKRFSTDERIVFLHSWNEWCEGTYLEPDARFGRKYLEQTRDAVELARQVIELYREANVNLDWGARALRLEKEKEEGAFRAFEVARATIHDMRRENDQLRQVAATANDLRQEVDQLRRETNRLQADARESEAIRITIAQLLQSSSWRVTGPLRAISRIIRWRS